MNSKNISEKQTTRAPRNRTITLSATERENYRKNVRHFGEAITLSELLDCTICQDIFSLINLLPDGFIDLLFADPPYNLTKTFNDSKFNRQSLDQYELWLDSWICHLPRLMKPNGSIYICGDWRSSTAIHRVLDKYFKVRNRITWEREKGRGAKANWKNNSEDIWFATVSDDYIFNLDAVKMKRQVIAPYKNLNGEPKDWNETKDGQFRTTHPSNLWTDLTVPFWSMPENTDHPTQKPEKLLAKIILASSSENDIIFDPFAGVGTTSVVSKKLGRRYIGVDIDSEYCYLAEKRLKLADTDVKIQGYADSVFWERNTLAKQKKNTRKV